MIFSSLQEPLILNFYCYGTLITKNTNKIMKLIFPYVSFYIHPTKSTNRQVRQILHLPRFLFFPFSTPLSEACLLSYFIYVSRDIYVVWYSV